jgi:hypothetical protein
MNWKIIKLKNLPSTKCWLMVLATGLCIQSESCKNHDPVVSAPVADNYVVVNVKFKANTSEKIKDSCLMIIKNMLIDSLKTMKSKYDYYSPSVSIVSYPLENDMLYSLKVSNKSYSKFRPVFPNDSSVIKVVGGPSAPCTCANHCQICVGLNTISNNNLDLFNNNIEIVKIEEDR